MTTAPRIHITANPRIRLQCGCLAHQVFAAESNTATRASIATPWNANRVGWATFQPATLNHGRSRRVLGQHDLVLDLQVGVRHALLTGALRRLVHWMIVQEETDDR